MDNGYTPNSDSDQSRTPLIIVTEVLPSEESPQDTTVKLV